LGFRHVPRNHHPAPADNSTIMTTALHALILASLDRWQTKGDYRWVRFVLALCSVVRLRGLSRSCSIDVLALRGGHES
jgi:hypothetical protein